MTDNVEIAHEWITIINLNERLQVPKKYLLFMI